MPVSWQDADPLGPQTVCPRWQGFGGSQEDPATHPTDPGAPPLASPLALPLLPSPRALVAPSWVEAAGASAAPPSGPRPTPVPPVPEPGGMYLAGVEQPLPASTSAPINHQLASFPLPFILSFYIPSRVSREKIRERADLEGPNGDSRPDFRAPLRAIDRRFGATECQLAVTLGLPGELPVAVTGRRRSKKALVFGRYSPAGLQLWSAGLGSPQAPIRFPPAPPVARPPIPPPPPAPFGPPEPTRGMNR